jgi:hypothetical protein
MKLTHLALSRFRESSGQKAVTTTPPPSDGAREPAVRLPGLDNLRQAPKLNRPHLGSILQSSISAESFSDKLSTINMGQFSTQKQLK